MFNMKKPCILWIFASVILLIPACSEDEPPIIEQVETEFGPIQKTSNLDSRHNIDVGRYESFLANGFVKEITDEDRRIGFSELRMFNPTSLPTKIDITLYFDNKSPIQLDQTSIDPLKNNWFMVMPGDLSNHFEDSEAWGMRIVSDVPVMLEHILVAGVAGPGDVPHMGNFKLKGGVSDQLAQPRAAKEWYFADGFELEYEDESTAAFPFNEFEWYHILNPGKNDAQVTLHCYYAGGQYEAFEFPVNAERVRLVSNQGLVRKNVSYGLIVTSTEPVVVQAERLIRDFDDFNDWGAWIHNSRPGLPGPIAVNPVSPGGGVEAP